MKVSNKLYLCKVCGKKKQLQEYYTYKSGKQIGKRTSRTCIMCTRDAMADYRVINKEKIVQYRKTYYSKDGITELERLRKKLWVESNRGHVFEVKRRYRMNNRERLKESLKSWNEKNRGRAHHNKVKYKVAKLQRIPKWVSEEELLLIKELYKLCSKMNKNSTSKYHVDHIIPLRGTSVSGLHTISNLRIILASDNLSKKNKLLENIEDIVCSYEKS
jgi:hypothetical protein